MGGSEGKLRPSRPGVPGEGDAEGRGTWQARGQGVCTGGAGVWGSWMALRVGGIHRGETLRPERAEDAWGRLSRARNALRYY